jgi:hypothetical protein
VQITSEYQSIIYLKSGREISFQDAEKKKNSANIIQQSIRGLIQHPRIINNQTQQQHQE